VKRRLGLIEGVRVNACHCLSLLVRAGHSPRVSPGPEATYRGTPSFAVITIKLRGLDKAIKQLDKFERSIPYAMADAVNSAAFQAREDYQRRIGTSFTLRNAFTKRSVQVTKANPKMGRIRSVMGSVAPYMAQQETGGRVPKKAIPGPVAAGQAPGAKRTKAVRLGSRLGRLRAGKGRPGSPTKQRNAVAIAQALRSGTKVAVLERGQGKGEALVRITGSRPKRRTRKGTLKLRLLYVVGRQGVVLRPTRMLEQTVRTIEPRIPRLMHEALVRQCRRNRLFGL